MNNEFNSNIDEKDWFLLLFLAKSGGISKGIRLTTQQIAEMTYSTQQTISRRLKSLIKKNLVQRIMGERIPVVKITDEGINLLKKVYLDLIELFNGSKFPIKYEGIVISGMGEGAYYIGLPHYFDNLTKILGKRPFLGTLNIQLNEDLINDYYLRIKLYNPIIIEGFKTEDRTFGMVKCYNIILYNKDNISNNVKALLLDIQRTSHKKGIVEVVSELNLREKLKLIDGSRVEFVIEKNNKIY